jgi:site-specific DNA recombinase
MRRKERGQSFGEKQAVIYCRVSTQEQVEGFSLTAQEKSCRDFCRKKGLGVLAVFVDEGESARTTDRPQFLQMLAYCQKHSESIDRVVVYRYDRFARSSLDHHTVRTLLGKYGITLVSATQEIEVSSPEGKLFETILAGFGQFESDVIGIRAKDGMTEARRQGKLTNPPPMGYVFSRAENGSSQVVIDERIAPHIREAFRLFATGEYTKAQVAHQITKSGFISPTGRQRLSPQNVDKLLRKRVYAGWVHVNEDEGWVRASFPPIVDQHVFDLVAARLEHKFAQSKPHSRVRSDFPLRGLVRCGHCGKYLTSSFSTGKLGTKYGYYRCYQKDCGKLEVRSEILESGFLDLLGQLAPSPEIVRDLRDRVLLIHRDRQVQVHEESRTVDAEIEALESRIFSLHESYVVDRKIVDPKVYRGLLARYQQQLAELRIRKEMLDGEGTDIQGLIDLAFHVLGNAKNLWLEYSPNQRTRLQRTIFPDGVQYLKTEDFGTPLTACEFNVLEFVRGEKDTMAGEQGFEPR